MPQISRIDKIGHTTDEVVELLAAGKLKAEIARNWGLPFMVLSDWLEADPVRSARAREAAELGAESWDEKALQALDDISKEATPGEIARAREMASHFRWRASKKSKAYRDEKTPTTVNINMRSDDELQKRLDELTSRAPITIDHDDPDAR